jgi:hypothetical protein
MCVCFGVEFFPILTRGLLVMRRPSSGATRYNALRQEVYCWVGVVCIFAVVHPLNTKALQRSEESISEY